MATPTIREAVSAAFDFGETGRQVTTGTGTQAGDTLLAFTVANFADADTPDGTWTTGVRAGSGSESTAASFTRTVTSSGAVTVSLPDNGANQDSESAIIVYVLVDVDSLDGQAGTTGTGTSQVAPSVSPTGADDLLVGVWVCGVFGGTVPDYTPPASMTQDAEPSDGAFMTGLGVHETLTASGATGTRTATATAEDTGWAAITTALLGTTAAGDVTGSGTATAPAATVDGSAAVTVAGTGQASVPSAVASGAGSVLVEGTGTVLVPAATVAGTGTLGTAEITGSGETVAPAVTIEGAGQVLVTGSGAATAPAALVEGIGSTGEPPVTGSGTATAPRAVASGTGAVTVDGNGFIVAPATIVSGTGAVVITGAGEATAPAAVVSGFELPVETPGSRTYVVSAEDRVHVVRAESRTSAVAAESRTLETA